MRNSLRIVNPPWGVVFRSLRSLPFSRRTRYLYRVTLYKLDYLTPLAALACDIMHGTWGVGSEAEGRAGLNL